MIRKYIHRIKLAVVYLTDHPVKHRGAGILFPRDQDHLIDAARDYIDIAKLTNKDRAKEESLSETTEDSINEKNARENGYVYPEARIYYDNNQ